MKVVILAGGEGKRLKPYTEVIPKPLLPIGEKPVLEIIFERLKNQGYKDIVLATNYKAYLFETLFGDGSKLGMNITYSRESKPLGTAGPLKGIEGQLTDDFFLMNGDLITDLQISDVEKVHRKGKADITVVTREIETPIPYGVIDVEGEKVLAWKEKPKIKSEISTGMYMINPGALRYIPENEFYAMNDLVGKVIENGGRVLRFLHSGEWTDIGLIGDYEKAQKDFEK